MKVNNEAAIPKDYKLAVCKELQGALIDVSYPVKNYINQSRQLVTNQKITFQEAGRETVLGEEIIKNCSIYLPAGYDENDKDTKYNVLYLLHGVGGNRYEWFSDNKNHDGNNLLCNIFDNLIANGDIEPLIVVFPEGRSTYDWKDSSFNSNGTNMIGFYYFDYELRYDLIPYIEYKFNTYANIADESAQGIVYNRMHRALAGLSMGGMQALNLGLGGYRCDSTEYTKGVSIWRNGLDKTVIAPGMIDLFDYVGAFSNEPTSSNGKLLGSSIDSSLYKLSLLYITCGDANEVAYQTGFLKAIDGLSEAAGDNLEDFYSVVIPNGYHNSDVWNLSVYNYIRLCFENNDVSI